MNNTLTTKLWLITIFIFVDYCIYVSVPLKQRYRTLLLHSTLQIRIDNQYLDDFHPSSTTNQLYKAIAAEKKYDILSFELSHQQNPISNDETPLMEINGFGG